VLKMSQTDIARLENLINNEKQSLNSMEQEKLALINRTETKKREILTANDRALQLPNSGPLILALFRESIELESVFLREKMALEQKISNQKRIIETRERELVQLKHSPQNIWSPSFK
jgi:hypothetical protein